MNNKDIYWIINIHVYKDKYMNKILIQKMIV